MKFSISLKEATEYIWHIIITVIVHEYTHHVYIYLTNITIRYWQQVMVYYVLDRENMLQF